MQRVQVVVSGLVQGVFFRDSCRREARRLGVSGWVCNAPDGTVVAEFQGEDAAVEAMVAWCEHGPPHAAVDRVEQRALEPRDESGFEVR